MTATAALVLAAGASTRYRNAGGRCETKLVDIFRGEPMVRHAVRAALGASCTPVLVVTGHAYEAVEAALAGLPVRFLHNPGFATGLASSLRVGLEALGAAEAAVVLLGDMPLVESGTVRRLIKGAADDPLAQAVVPVAGGVRGNPVLLRRSLFGAAARLTGDEGARRLLRDPALALAEVAMVEAGVRVDVDEPGGFEP